MKDFVRPTINGTKETYPVIAGIEAELEEEGNRVVQPRILPNKRKK